MSDQEQKDKHSKRLHQEQSAINRQVKIAKSHHEPVDEPHRLAKHHAMDCGNPECGICGNPRHIHKQGGTKQEKSFEQTKSWTQD